LPGFEDVKAKLIAKLMNLIGKAELDQKIFFFWCLIMDKQHKQAKIVFEEQIKERI